VINQFTSLINGLPYPIVVFDEDLKPFLCNTTYTDFSTSCPANFLEYLQNYLKEKEPKEATFVLNPTHQTSFSCSMHSQIVNDHVYKIVSIRTNETPKQQMQDLKEGFLRTVSHELRTPLTTVIGFIELVYFNKDNPIESLQKSYLKTALSEARSLKILIDDLLSFALLKSKKADLELSTFHLKIFISKILESLIPLKKDKPIMFKSTVDQDSLSIRADKHKLKRILINLVSNAVKFTPSGTITVSVDEREADFLFSVTDTGIGIEESDQEKIFEEFSQLDYSTTRAYEGMGLGLSFVKQLVELHGGDVWVTSIPKEGSTFFFTISKTN